VRFGTWKVRSLYRIGSLKTVTSKLAKYNKPSGSTRGLMENGGSEPADK